MNKKFKEYESPVAEVLEMEPEGAVLMTSLTGEDINGWEDM